MNDVDSTGPASKERSSSPRRRLQAAILSMTLLMALAAWGCADGSSGELPFAKSAPTAGLALMVKMPAAPPLMGAGVHAAAVPIGATATRLALQIGEPGAADTIVPPPFAISGSPKQILSFTVGNIPPGLRKRVEYEATDASGNVVGRGLFFLDFLPGQLTSNDLDLGVPGGGTGGPTKSGFFIVALSGSGTLVRVDPAAQTYARICTGLVPSPHSVIVDRTTGDYIVTQFGTVGNISRIGRTGSRTEIVAAQCPRGLVQLPDGRFLVSINGEFKIVDSAGTMQSAHQFLDSNEGIPIALCLDGSGNVYVTEQFKSGPYDYKAGIVYNAGYVSEVFAPLFLTRNPIVDYDALCLSSMVPTGVAVSPLNGDLYVTEDNTGMLVRITPGSPPIRTVVRDFGGAGLSEIVADTEGCLFVCERANETLSRVCPDGSRTVIVQFDPGSAPLGLCKSSF